MKIAFQSALSATADKKSIEKRYQRIEKLEKDAPFVVESKFIKLKTKEIVSGLKKIFGGELEKIIFKTKQVRSGRGKLRGRKYKSNAGLLIVVGKKEKLKTNVCDVVNVNELNVGDLAEGGVGRLVLYTESAVNELGEMLK